MRLLKFEGVVSVLNTEKSKTALNEDQEDSSPVLSYGGYEYKHRYEKLMRTKTAEQTSVRITAVIAFAVFFTAVVVALACLLILNIVISERGNNTDAVLDIPTSRIDGDDPSYDSSAEQIKDICQHATVSVLAGSDELTGIFVTSDGYIITGGVPCLDAENVFVNVSDEKLSAKVIGMNEDRNIAVLKVNSSSHVAADFGYGECVMEGDNVFVAYKCAGAYKFSEASVVSFSESTISISGIGFESCMFGAAVIDGEGRVIGIITHGKNDGVCAVTSSSAISTIRKFVKDTIQIDSDKNSKIEWLGASVIEITDDDSRRFGLPGGVMVVKTERLSLAEHIGLLPNDIIIGIESFAVNSAERLNDIISSHSGKTVSLLVYRNERYINLNLDVDN